MKTNNQSKNEPPERSVSGAASCSASALIEAAESVLSMGDMMHEDGYYKLRDTGHFQTLQKRVDEARLEIKDDSPFYESPCEDCGNIFYNRNGDCRICGQSSSF